jgi:hypothetical protein
VQGWLYVASSPHVHIDADDPAPQLLVTTLLAPFSREFSFQLCGESYG